MDIISENSVPAEDQEGARRLINLASEAMQIQSVRWVDRGLSQVVGRPTPSDIGALEIRGKLLMDSERVYASLAGRFEALGYVLLLRQDGDAQRILALPGELPRSAGKPWLAAALFAATVLSVLYAGAGNAGIPDSLWAGVPFAVSLLGILVAHEMGHYVVARWLRVPASLPYFIPMPVFLLGTMGAVIQTTAPPRNRKALVLLGAAGPLAGMVVALPVLIYGLMHSQVGVAPPGLLTYQEGNSVLYAWLKLLIFGQFLPAGRLDVWLDPVALAGWAGLLVTGMNLIPAGQLDGGHVTYALLGSKARWVNWGVVVVLLGLSVLWPGWLLWAGLVLFLGRVHSVPLDDVTPLGTKEKAIALLSVVTFLLVFIPIPMVIK